MQMAKGRGKPHQKPPLPDSPEVKEHKAVVDTVIQLLNVETELIKTGRAPNGSAVNIDLVIHDLLPRLSQQRFQRHSNQRQLSQATGELGSLAELLKDTQQEHKMVVRSVSGLELEEQERNKEIIELEKELALLTHQTAANGSQGT